MARLADSRTRHCPPPMSASSARMMAAAEVCGGWAVDVVRRQGAARPQHSALTRDDKVAMVALPTMHTHVPPYRQNAG